MKKNKLEIPLVFVSGSGHGLGAYLAESFSKKGYGVILHYRSRKSEAIALGRRLKALAVFQGDLGVESKAQAIALEIRKRFGVLDCLVNNAGVYSPKRLVDLSSQEWWEGLNSTASSTFFMTKALLPLIRGSKNGRIINIGDSSCDRLGARDLAMSYHIGKTGVLMLTKSFAQSEGGDGVTVNMVSPGWLENSVGKLSKKEIPAGRYGKFEDIWNAVEFLIKPESNYVNGSNVVVGGGWNLR